jgi:predicted nucleotidyltransferase
MAKVDVSPQVLSAVAEVFATHAPGRPVYLFGSRVTGLAQPDSDLDMVVGGETALQSGQLSTIRCAIEDVRLPYKVDVLDIHEAKGIFRKRIEAEWIPLTEAQPEPSLQAIA